MMDNQAFGWLKKSIMGGGGGGESSGIDEDIANCSDPSILVNGVAHDFKMLLLLSSTSSNGTNISAPPDTKLSISSAAVASEGSSAATIVDATQSKLTSDGAPKSTPTNNHSDNLTARLDRIKTLLYEERSASSNSVTQNGGVINLNWIPNIATGVFKSFTLSTQSDTSYEVANDTTVSDDMVSISAAAISDYKKLNTNELIPTILQNLPLLQFEARKSISAIFNYLLVCGIDGNDAQSFTSVSTAFAKYVLDRGDVIIGQLVNGHDCSEVVINKNGMSGSGMKGSVLEAASSAATGNSGGGGGSCVDITLLCGSMLRSSIRHANIYQYILSNEHCNKLVYPFFDQFVHNPNFDVSSDALETVRVMLSGMPGGSNQQVAAAAGGMVGDTASEEYKQLMESIASDFLNRKYTEIINERINKKCLSSSASYMTRRMSLQLLSTILLNRVNYNVMMMYISSSKNLVIILCLLRDPSPHITLDAFQVFKIFVANPNKPPEVIKILFDNKVKLVKYLEGLHKERENNDDQYRDEKQLVVSTLEALEI